MNQSKETQQKQEQLSSNLGKLFPGIEANGRKEMPKPSIDTDLFKHSHANANRILLENLSKHV
jgi:hypothetical protein